MGVTLILLIIALVPTGHISSDENIAAVPAACLYSEEHIFEFFNHPLIAFLLVILLVSYITRVVKLFTALSDPAYKWLRIKPGDFVKGLFDSAKLGQDSSSGFFENKMWTGLLLFLMFSYVFFKAIYEIGESMLCEVCTPTRYMMV